MLLKGPEPDCLLLFWFSSHDILTYIKPKNTNFLFTLLRLVSFSLQLFSQSFYLPILFFFEPLQLSLLGFSRLHRLFLLHLILPP